MTNLRAQFLSLNVSAAGPLRDLIVADGSAPEIRQLLQRAPVPAIAIDETDDALQAITTVLAGESLDTLHLVAHGDACGFTLAGRRVDARALSAGAALLAQWRVRRIALWSCGLGETPAFARTLARLTGAEVFAADGFLGQRDGERRWLLSLAAASGEAPALPFDADVAADWPHTLASVSVTFPGLFIGMPDATDPAFDANTIYNIRYLASEVTFTQADADQGADPLSADYDASGGDVYGTLEFTFEGDTFSLVGKISRQDANQQASTNPQVKTLAFFFYQLDTEGNPVDAFLLPTGFNPVPYAEGDDVSSDSSPPEPDLNAYLAAVSDTTVPDAPVITNVTEPGSDPTPADLLTADDTQDLTVTGETGGGILVYEADGTLVDPSHYTVSESSGTYTVDFGSYALADGDYYVTLTDIGGNESLPSNPFTIDTGVDTDALDITDDTDSGADDLLTNDGNPVLTFTGEPGLTITIEGPEGDPLDASQYDVQENTVAGVSTYTVTLKDAKTGTVGDQPFGDYAGGAETGNAGTNVGDGIYTIVATDDAGNAADVDTFVIDTTPPPAPTVNSQVTNDTLPTIRGTADAQPGDTLTVTVNGATYENVPVVNGVWIIDTGSRPVSAGTLGRFVNGQSYSVEAVLTDAQGNASTDATSGEVVIDTKVAVRDFDMTDGTDSGRSQGDELTSHGRPVLTFEGDPNLRVTLEGPDGTLLTQGVHFTLESDNGRYMVRLIDATAGGAAADPFGTYAGGVATGNPAATADGTYTIKIFDGLGNGAVAGTFVIDTTPPKVPTVTIVEDADDDARIAGGELSGEIDVSVALPADAVAGDLLRVTDGAVVRSFTLTAAQLAAGKVLTSFQVPAAGAAITVTAQVTDGAGNQGADGQDAAKLDVTGPAAPVVTIVEDANDDRWINGAELAAEVDVSVRLPADAVAGDLLRVTDGATVRSFTLTAAQVASGVVAASFAAPAQGGTITVSANVTDALGNPGAMGSDWARLDTIAPEVAISAIASDTNAANDFVTQDRTLVFMGRATPGQAVTLTLDGVAIGTAVADGSGLWSFDHTGTTLASGLHSLVATVTDAAGNRASATQAVRIDTEAPGQNGDGVAPAITAISNDTDVPGDFVTTDGTLVFLGTAGAGDAVTVTLDGVTLGTVNADAAGVWRFDHTGATLSQGTHALAASTTDAAGNLRSVERAVTVFSAGLDPDSDDGASNRDRVTSVVQPEFDVVGGQLLQPGGYVRLVDADGRVVGVSMITPEDAAAGRTGVTAMPLDDGQWRFNAQILDGSGRILASTPVDVTILTDRDGVMPSVERAANGGDFNRDGTPDWQQNNVAQLPLASAEAFAQGAAAPDETFGALLAGDVDPANPGAPVALDAGAQLLDLQVVALPAPLPAGVAAVTPGLDFAVTSQDGRSLQDLDASRPGLQARVVIDLPAGGVEADTWLKWDAAAGKWDVFLDDGDLATYDDGATLVDADGDGRVQRVVVTLTDNAAGDADPATGVLRDPGLLALSAHEAPAPVFSVRLANGDRYYTVDAAEAAHMASGTGNVFEGARFDALDVADGGRAMHAYRQPFTGDWFFAADGQPMPYECYLPVSGAAGFGAAAPGQGEGTDVHLFVDGNGLTQLVSAADAAALGLAGLGYFDHGALFRATTEAAFAFDVEGYLVANRSDASVRALVDTLAAGHRSTAEAGFVEAVEQHYLAQVALVGIAHGGAADAADVNAAFGTQFLG